MSKEQATHRPWQIGLDSHGTSIDGKINGNWYPIADINVPMIAELGSDNAIDIQESNAKLIVKCVNMHEELIEALKKCSTELQYHINQIPDFVKPISQQVLDKAKQAIAKAGEL